MKVTEHGTNFVLHVPSSRKKEIAPIMAYRGLTFSTSASSRDKAVLWSINPYSVCDLADEETPTLLPYRRQVELSRATDGKGTSRLPPGLELWDYQKATLDYLLARGGGINGDQPGLGKTPTSIAYANERQAQRVLVICPASVRLQWAERIREWSTIPMLKVSTMLKVKDGIHPNAHYQILSYDAARNPAIIRAISKYKWDLLICDEAHKMKNIDALTTRAILGNSRGEYQHGEHKMKAIAHYCRERLALTGTLLLNRPSECLAASTQVLTNRGWKAIVDVQLSDKLWDGDEWVAHDGLLYQGCATTVNVGQISATPTHNFLAKSTWVSADEVRQNSDLWNLTLEKGSENLPFNLWGAMRAALSLPNADVTAEKALPRQFKNYVRGQWSGADRVVQETVPKKPIQNIIKFVRTLFSGRECFHAFKAFGIDATTGAIPCSNTTVEEESKFILNGCKTAQLFWRICFHYRATMFRAMNLIGSTTIGDMSQEISGSLVNARTKPTSGKLATFKQNWMLRSKKSPCSEHVYDIANAGPRQRFTVLSSEGPVIAHNCYNLIRFFDHEAIDFMSEDKFKDRYNKQADMRTIEGKRFKLESTSLETELQNRLRVNVMARHEKSEVLKFMKPPRYAIVRCEENGAVQGALAAEGMLGISLDEIQTTKDFEILGHIAEARRLMGVALAPQISDYAKDFLEGSDEKLVIFGWHLEVLDIFEKELAAFGTVRIDGRKSPLARQKAVDDFINDPKIRVFIGNIQTAGTGLDGLQKVCSRCYLAEPDWVPAQNEQAVSRLDRFGQENLVTAEIFVAPGSISEKILVRALEKLNVIHRVLDEKEK
jgi:hypothetical protein